MKKVMMLVVVMCFALCSISFAQGTSHKEAQSMGQQTKHPKHHKHHKRRHHRHVVHHMKK